VKVWVEKDKKGKHWSTSLCPQCELFAPATTEHCPIESFVYTTSKQHEIVLVV